MDSSKVEKCGREQHSPQHLELSLSLGLSYLFSKTHASPHSRFLHPSDFTTHFTLLPVTFVNKYWLHLHTSTLRVIPLRLIRQCWLGLKTRDLTPTPHPTPTPHLTPTPHNTSQNLTPPQYHFIKPTALSTA